MKTALLFLFICSVLVVHATAQGKSWFNISRTIFQNSNALNHEGIGQFFDNLWPPILRRETAELLVRKSHKIGSSPLVISNMFIYLFIYILFFVFFFSFRTS